MTLAVEKHDGELWMVVVHSNHSSELLALFKDEAAADLWKLEHNRSMLMAREVGRMGLG